MEEAAEHIPGASRKGAPVWAAAAECWMETGESAGRGALRRPATVTGTARLGNAAKGGRAGELPRRRRTRGLQAAWARSVYVCCPDRQGTRGRWLELLAARGAGAAGGNMQGVQAADSVSTR
jgi:hypothetical protein